ncbi:MAG: glycoside hydrolase family 15 protein [Rhodospirillales bacterium]|nr:glycoside hydrolase family 15 protein [Rhodospirillales bacterium]
MMQNLDLAVIGNSIIAALIDRNGQIVWWCFPRLDGDPVFCRLLNGDNGDFGFCDVQIDSLARSTQHYVENTAVLTTTLTDAGGGSVRVVDFAPRFKQYDRIFRPAMIVRRIEPIGGSCHVRVRFRPRFRYGAQAPALTHGSNHIRYVGEDFSLRLSTDGPISYILEERSFLLTQPISLILGHDETITGSINRLTREFLERTEEYWLDWVRYLSIPFEWQETVIRAAITLKLCSFEETGAVVAALTTSIPEAPDTSRTWDYRYCWLRDAYFVVHALNRLGATKTMEHFIGYVTTVAAEEPGGRLKPLYGLVPGAPLRESVVETLAGYRNMGPVRKGNLAESQDQHDGYGSVILAATQMFFDRRLPRRGDKRLFTLLTRLGENAARLAFEPDSGIWEYRGRRRIHTHSAAMCWAACNRLSRIAESLGDAGETQRWAAEAHRIREAVLARAWDDKNGSFVDALDGGNLDTSLLLLSELGFISAEDPRFVSTVERVTRELRRNGNLMRYAHEDDFGAPRTAFNVCTFWYINALYAIGRQDEARELFTDMLNRRNHVGLLSEDIDVDSGELWGNFPQTYSMVGLVTSAMRLSKSWEKGIWRGL